MRLKINHKGKLEEIKKPNYPFLDGYIGWNPSPPTGTPWDPIETYYVDGQIIERLL